MCPNFCGFIAKTRTSGGYARGPTGFTLCVFCCCPDPLILNRGFGMQSRGVRRSPFAVDSCRCPDPLILNRGFGMQSRGVSPSSFAVDSCRCPDPLILNRGFGMQSRGVSPSPFAVDSCRCPDRLKFGYARMVRNAA
jgi:hypothetical protein